MYWLFRPKKYVPNTFSCVDEKEAWVQDKTHINTCKYLWCSLQRTSEILYDITYMESLFFSYLFFQSWKISHNMMKKQLQLVILSCKILSINWIFLPKSSLILSSMGVTLEDIKFFQGPCQSFLRETQQRPKFEQFASFIIKF